MTFMFFGVLASHPYIAVVVVVVVVVVDVDVVVGMLKHMLIWIYDFPPTSAQKLLKGSMDSIISKFLVFYQGFGAYRSHNIICKILGGTSTQGGRTNLSSERYINTLYIVRRIMYNLIFESYISQNSKLYERTNLSHIFSCDCT